MKVSVVKFPALFGFLYTVFMIGTVITASVLSAKNGFSVAAVGAEMITWAHLWWWLTPIGVVLHVFAYIKGMRYSRLVFGNLLGACAFVAYGFVPNYTPVIAVVYFIAVAMILGFKRRPSQEAVMD